MQRGRGRNRWYPIVLLKEMLFLFSANMKSAVLIANSAGKIAYLIRLLRLKSLLWFCSVPTYVLLGKRLPPFIIINARQFFLPSVRSSLLSSANFFNFPFAFQLLPCYRKLTLLLINVVEVNTT